MLQLQLTPFPILITERLLLRQLETGDAKEIFLLRSDEIVNKYIDRPKANSLDDTQKFINKINTGISNNETVFWAIVPKDSQKLIGTITLWNISKENSRAEIGYELLPDFHGKGIMQEAISKVIEFGFSTMKLQTIEAWAHEGNIQSSKLLERNNFKRDIHLEREHAGKEELKSMVIYSLNVSDYTKILYGDDATI